MTKKPEHKRESDISWLEKQRREDETDEYQRYMIEDDNLIET